MDDDAPRALFLEQRSRRKKGGLLASIKYKSQYMFKLIQHGNATSQLSFAGKQSDVEHEKNTFSTVSTTMRHQVNYIVNWIAFNITQKSVRVVCY